MSMKLSYHAFEPLEALQTDLNILTAYRALPAKPTKAIWLILRTPPQQPLLIASSSDSTLQAWGSDSTTLTSPI